MGHAPITVYFGVQLSGGELSSWAIAGAVTVVIATLLGPVAWSLRSRTPEREEHSEGLLTLVGVMVLIAVVVGAELVVERGVVVAGLGITLGSITVLLVELILIPERLSNPLLR